jgi:hypothetical protein
MDKIYESKHKIRNAFDNIKEVNAELERLQKRVEQLERKQPEVWRAINKAENPIAGGVARMKRGFTDQVDKTTYPPNSNYWLYYITVNHNWNLDSEYDVIAFGTTYDNTGTPWFFGNVERYDTVTGLQRWFIKPSTGLNSNTVRINVLVQLKQYFVYPDWHDYPDLRPMNVWYTIIG